VNISAPFIARPVATTLLTIAVVLAGMMAFRTLPVSPLPQVDFPTISVTAGMPGASPETMAATVATPLERALGRIAGVTEMTSSSSLGSTRVVLQFDLNRDIDGAARDVQAAINGARTLLPTGLPSNPTYRKVNPADAPIMILALTSETRTQGQMYDAASTILAQKLSQVQGVGQVTVGGSSLPAVRVELNPHALYKYGIGTEDVRIAITNTNVNRPKGSIEEGERHWQILANDQAKKAADYMPIVVAYRNNSPVRLTDVAEVVDSVQDLRNAGSSNGKPSVLLIINRQPGANIIETVDRVKELIPILRASIPSDLDLELMLDRTPTIRGSLRETERTLVIAIALVILVVFAFLRDWRATLIPSVAVPVSLIGTFGVMWLCNYSLNNLSLMALIIATGFVVDDAIVVLENIARRIEHGEEPRAAALAGAKEVGFTVLSMSLSLIAVFIPILLMGGIVGRLFREFAVVLSVAILISLVVSVTTTPMMCALFLKKKSGEEKHGRLSRWSEGVFNLALRGYQRSLGWALRHKPLTLLILALTIALNFALYVIVPKGFFPQQDAGRLVGSIQADQGISFQAMREKLATFIQIVREDPAVENVVGFSGGGGFGGRNTGSMFVTLKSLDERKLSADRVVARLRTSLAKEPGASLFLVPVQDIRIGGRQANAQYQFTLLADDLDQLRYWEPRMRAAMSELPEIVDVSSDRQDKGVQTSLVIDRDRASQLGVTTRMIDTTLNNAFGQRLVSTIYNPLNQYRVVMEAAPEHWQSPEALKSVHVTGTTRTQNADGTFTTTTAQVPLASFSRYETTNTPLSVAHQSQFAAATISFNLPPDVSLSKATDAIYVAMDRIGVPTGVYGTFAGTATRLPGLAGQPADPDPHRADRGLPGARHALRERGAPDHHPLHAALGWRGRDPRAADHRLGAEHHLADRRDPADRHRQEERHHDDRLRRRRAAPRRPRAGQGDLRGLPGALPADHDDHHGRAAGGGAAGDRLRRGRRAAPAARHRHRRRPHRQPAADTLYDAGGLHLPRRAARAPVRRPQPQGNETEADVMRRPLPLLLLLSIALLAACTVGPDYKRPTLEVPAAYKEYGEWKPAQPADLQPRGDWWAMFGDAELDALMKQVDVSNQTIAAAEAQVRISAALAAQARASWWPTVNGTVQVTKSKPSSTTGPIIGQAASERTIYSLPLQASWEIDLWGRIRRLVESGDAATLASASDLVNARLSAQATLAQSYFGLRALDLQKQLLDETAAAYLKTLELTRNRYNAGIVSRLDVVQAETQYNSARAQALDSTVQRAQLEHAIAVLAGIPPSSFKVGPGSIAAAPPGVPAVGLPADLLERRPDVAAAERRVEQANAQIGVAKAAWFPVATLAGTYGFQSAQSALWFSAPSNFWSMGVALALTIFDGGRPGRGVRPGRCRVRPDGRQLSRHGAAGLRRGGGQHRRAAHPRAGGGGAGRHRARRAAVAGHHPEPVPRRHRHHPAGGGRAGGAAQRAEHRHRHPQPPHGRDRPPHQGPRRRLGPAVAVFVG
jgi:multidrug efflux pump